MGPEDLMKDNPQSSSQSHEADWRRSKAYPVARGWYVRKGSLKESTADQIIVSERISSAQQTEQPNFFQRFANAFLYCLRKPQRNNLERRSRYQRRVLFRKSAYGTVSLPPRLPTIIEE